MFIIRRNQIIIVALVIMIAVAGYLNYSDGKLDGDNLVFQNEFELAQNEEPDVEMVDATQVPELAANTEGEEDDIGTAIFVNNLKKEGILKGVCMTGDVMYDAALIFGHLADSQSYVLENLNIQSGSYFLCTVHRPSNTDDKNCLESIMDTLIDSNEKIVFPIHPRTLNRLQEFNDH